MGGLCVCRRVMHRILAWAFGSRSGKGSQTLDYWSNQCHLYSSISASKCSLSYFWDCELKPDILLLPCLRAALQITNSCIFFLNTHQYIVFENKITIFGSYLNHLVSFFKLRLEWFHVYSLKTVLSVGNRGISLTCVLTPCRVFGVCMMVIALGAIGAAAWVIGQSVNADWWSKRTCVLSCCIRFNRNVTFPQSRTAQWKKTRVCTRVSSLLHSHNGSF